jgi:hypothetical protein
MKTVLKQTAGDAPKRKRGRPRKNPEAEQPANDAKYIRILAKKVTGEENRKYLSGETLEIGKDVSAEVAVLFVKNGQAIPIEPDAIDKTDEEHLEIVAQSFQDQLAVKQRADRVMAQHDEKSKEERDRANYATRDDVTDHGDEN